MKMATSNTSAISTLAIILLLIVGPQVLVSAQCEGAIPALIAQCSEYVRVSGPKIPPSIGCCQVVKGLNVDCMCKLVTPEVERMVSMDKVVYVARTCGVTVQPGMHCGSKAFVI